MLNHNNTPGEVQTKNTGSWYLPSETITDGIFNNLPQLLRDACNQFTEPTEREVFLIGALGVLSACMPNYIGHYDGKWISPHLYVYILAPFGSGKGTMTYSRQLGEAIHATKIAETKVAMDLFNHAPKSTKTDKTDKTDSASPIRPANKMLFIPANSSKTAMIETLADNKGQAAIFETEGDTLADSLKQDYGSYSDILRKAFHHEPIAYIRRADKEFRELNNPHLAVILSSTYDQLLGLIPTSENGLFSRFIFYSIKPKKGFKDVFAPDMEGYQPYFSALGQTIEQRYSYLTSLEKAMIFWFTDAQKAHFLAHFRKTKEESIDGLGGSINRLGIICFRLAMLLSMLRAYETDFAPSAFLICDNVDFYNAIALADVLKLNAERVYKFVNSTTSQNKAPEDLQKLYDALPAEFSTATGIEIAVQLGINERKAERYFSKHFTNTSHGNYAKKQK